MNMCFMFCVLCFYFTFAQKSSILQDAKRPTVGTVGALQATLSPVKHFGFAKQF